MHDYIISAVLFVSFSLYAVIAAFSVVLDRKSKVNISLFLICLCYMVCCLSNAIVIVISDPQQVVFFRKIAALGWGSVYSYILYFSLLMTRNTRIINSRLVKALIFIPAILNCLVYSIFSSKIGYWYYIIKQSERWQFLPTNFGWDIVYTLYTIIFLSISLYSFLHWKLDNGAKISNNSKYFIVGTTLVTVVLSLIGEIMLLKSFSNHLALLAPAVALAPLMAAFYIIQQKTRVNPFTDTDTISHTLILKDELRSRFTSNLALTFMIGSYLNIFQGVADKSQFISILLFGVFLVFLSLVVMVLPYIVKNIKTQDTIIILSSIVICGLLMLKFNLEYTSNLTWTVIFVFMSSAVLLKDKFNILILAVSNIVFIVTLMKRVPTLLIDTNWMDIIIRSAVYLAVFSIALFVNSVFIHRISSNHRQAEFEKMIYEISNEFIDGFQGELSNYMQSILQRVSEFYTVDTIACGIIDDKNTSFVLKNKTIVNQLFQLESIQTLLYNELALNEAIMVLNTTIDSSQYIEILQEEKAYKIVVQSLPESINTVLLFPLMLNHHYKGYLLLVNGSFSNQEYRKVLYTMKVISNIISTAIGKDAYQQQKKYLAYYDYLTKIPNRMHFNEHCEKLINKAKVTKEEVIVAMIDLDGFKEINDTMGHNYGDEVIVTITNRLKMVINDQGLLARFGGDEFLAVFSGHQMESKVIACINELMQQSKLPLLVKDQEFIVTMSIGVSFYPEDGETVDTLIKNADLAMYWAKQHGKNQYALCKKEMKVFLQEKIKTQKMLQSAMEHQEINYLFKPIYDTKNNEVIAYTVLLYWPNSDNQHTIQYAADIIEDNRLIMMVERWRMKESCKLSMNISFPLIVSISQSYFFSSDFEQDIKQLSTYDSLIIQVTESTVMKNYDVAYQRLMLCKEKGLKIIIDQFGNEHSSLSKLKVLPVSNIVIAPVFTDGILNNTNDKSIIDIIVKIANILHVEVIADGIENNEQLNYIKQVSCQYYSSSQLLSMEDVIV